eukprot:m.344164 g.344164  ORF g.344164 m.344164 type:complete len:164 (+) comp23908_c0_seq1:162-653(+)
MGIRSDLRRHPAIGGIILATALGITFTSLPIFDTMMNQVLVCVFIALMQGVYWGFAVSNGDYKALLQESLFGAAFCWVAAQIILLLLARSQVDGYFLTLVHVFKQPSNPYGFSTGIGVALHGCYDLMHHFHMVPFTSHVPHGYPMACAVTDFLLGSYLAYRWM